MLSSHSSSMLENGSPPFLHSKWPFSESKGHFICIWPFCGEFADYLIARFSNANTYTIWCFVYIIRIVWICEDSLHWSARNLMFCNMVHNIKTNFSQNVRISGNFVCNDYLIQALEILVSSLHRFLKMCFQLLNTFCGKIKESK